MSLELSSMLLLLPLATFARDRLVPNKGKEREQTRQAQEQHPLQCANAALKTPFHAGVRQHALQELHAASDSGMLPRLQPARLVPADAVQGGDFLKRADKSTY